MASTAPHFVRNKFARNCEHFNWDGPCRYIPLTVFRGSGLMLSTRPNATNGGEKHHLFILKNKIRSIRIVALADQEGGKMQNEMNFNERVSEEILHIKERKFRVFCHKFCYAVLTGRRNHHRG